jgi:hypothetical protein
MFLKPLFLLLAVPVSVALADDKAPAAGKAAPLPEAPAAAPATTPSPASDAAKALPLAEPAPRLEPLPLLLPDQILPPSKPQRQPVPPQPRKLGSTLRPPTTALDLELRIRYRKARNIAESDPKVREAWESSRVAGTDYEKRQALKRYYDVLYGRMLSIDRGIAPLVDGRKRDQAVALEQLQIAPTVPLR